MSHAHEPKKVSTTLEAAGRYVIIGIPLFSVLPFEKYTQAPNPAEAEIVSWIINEKT
jgi:hypothetical protein